MGKVKIKAFLLSIIMLISVFPVTYAENDDKITENKYAELIFEKEMKTTKIDMVWFQESGAYTIEKEQDKYGVWMQKQSNYMLINVSDGYWYSEDADSVAITVEYLDSGGGTFTLRHGSSLVDWDDSADVVKLTNSGEWKTHTFYINDIAMCNKVNMSDFMLAMWSSKMSFSPEPVFIHSVKIEQCYPRDPIIITPKNGYAGNIYDINDSDDMSILFENTTDVEVTGNATYVIKDANGILCSEGSLGEITIPNNDVKTLNFNTGVSECGIYTIDVIFEGKALPNGELYEFKTVRNGKFSIARTWKEGMPRNDIFWFTTHFGLYDPEKGPEVAARSGAGGVRDGLSEWSGVEREKGLYDAGEKGNAIVERVKNYGLDNLCIASYGNPLYSADSPFHKFNVPKTQAEYDALANYGAWIAKRYSNEFCGIEVWNEWNNGAFNYNGGTPEHYAEALKASYKAIKAANPDMKVVGMVTLGSGEDWIDDVLAAGGYDYCDVISIHPYTWSDGAGRLKSLISKTNAVKDVVAKYGGQKPIWFSEIGWYTTESGYGISDDEQAQLIVKTPIIADAYDLCEKYMYYDLQEDGTSESDSESNFGITDSNLSENPLAAKKAYIAVCAYNNLMPNAEFVDKIEYDEMNFCAYRFKRQQGDYIIPMWTMDGQREVSFDLGCSSVELFDVYGNSKGILKSNNGIFTFNATQNQMYVVGDCTKFEEAVGVFSQTKLSTAVANDTITFHITDKSGRNLSVDASINGNEAQIIKNNGMINGNCDIVIKTFDTLADDVVLSYRLYDDKGTYYIGNSVFDIVSPLKTSIGTTQVANNSNRWQAVISVTNPANSSIMNGNCKIIAPLEYAQIGKEVKFFNIEPHETKNVYINIPEMIRKRTDYVTVKITLDNGYSEEVTGRVDFTTAYYAEAPPVIDGKIGEGEWDKGYWVSADKAEHTKEAVDWTGAEDLSFIAKFMYDKDNFYLLTVATDDIMSQTNTASNMWAGDGIQFGFEDLIGRGQLSNTAFTELGFALIDGKPAVYRWSTLYDNPTGEVTNFTGAIVREGNKTYYELALPWSEVFKPEYTLEENIELGFSMMLNEDDGKGRQGWIQYNDGIGLSKDARLFGRMKLKKQ